jgi:hypothetical protein
LLNPQILLNAIAEKLRLIPELANVPVYTYDESFPVSNDLMLGIWKLKAPGLLVIWRGTSPGAKTGMEAWRHSYSIAVRATSDTNMVATPSDYFTLWTAIMNGVPADGNNCDFRHSHLHEAVYQVQPPSILRQTIFVTPESRLDYYEIFLNYDEKGDY